MSKNKPKSKAKDVSAAVGEVGAAKRTEPVVPENLPDVFHHIVTGTIDANGVYPHVVITVNHDGYLTAAKLLFITASSVMDHVKDLVHRPDTRALIFGTDRYARPGQGTKLGDLIAGVFWPGGPLAEIKPFVIEYQHEPRVVKAMNWRNRFWNQQIKLEWQYVCR